MPDRASLSHQVALTKGHKLLRRDLDKFIAAAKAAIAKRPAADPNLIMTSSETKFGIDVLRAEIEKIVRT